MAKLWKLKRELSRLGQQLRAIPERFYEPLLQKHHDKNRENFPILSGAVSRSPKIAIVLVYQPNGIKPELTALLRSIIKQGGAPFVICNSALGANDREVLGDVCWLAMERPNFGYDFGGYRDAVLYLLENNIPLDALWVFNDSVALFAADFGSIDLNELPSNAVSGGILRERGAERFLESYFYAIPDQVFQHPAFAAYWKNYALTDNKYKVIRRGERGFSRAVQDAGIPIHPIFNHAHFIEALSDCSHQALVEVLSYSSYRSDKDTQALQTLMSNVVDSDEWRALALDHVKNVLRKDVFNSAYPVGAIKLLNFPFIKKSNELVNRKWRDTLARAIRDGVLPQPVAEIASLLDFSSQRGK